MMEDTLKNLSRGKVLHKGEDRLYEHIGARYTTDGMKLAKALAISAFYNATCEYIPKKELRKVFEDFYEKLDTNINLVGKSGNIADEKDVLFGTIVNVLRRLDIPKEKWRYFV